MLKYVIALLLVIGLVPSKLYNADNHFGSSYSVSQSINGASEEKDKENLAFRNVKVRKENNEFTITGEARLRNSELFYMVEDGHNELISEKIIKLDLAYPKWSQFKIKLKIADGKLPKNRALIMYLFERSEDGKQVINNFPLVIYKQPGS